MSTNRNPVLFLLVPVLALAAVGCSSGGGGGGGGGSSADTTAPAIGTPSSSLHKASSGDASEEIVVTITDAGGVASASVRVTGPGAFDQTLAMTASGSQWSATVPVSPPLLGTDTYSYTITATDESGNVTTESGSFDVAGTSPPSTSSAPF